MRSDKKETNINIVVQIKIPNFWSFIFRANNNWLILYTQPCLPYKIIYNSAYFDIQLISSSIISLISENKGLIQTLKSAVHARIYSF